MAKEKVTILHRWLEEVLNEGVEGIVIDCPVPKNSTTAPLIREGTLMFWAWNGTVVEAWSGFDFLKRFQRVAW